MHPFNEDGHQFIRNAARRLLDGHRTVTVYPKLSRQAKQSKNVPPPTVFKEPKTFSHYVMNLPASAISFLSAFIGLYRKREQLFYPFTEAKLPTIHVHCFSSKSDDNKAEEKKICAQISEQLEYTMNMGKGEMSIHRVRDVAPNKVMFCTSFRLPPEVAFRSSASKDGSRERRDSS